MKKNRPDNSWFVLPCSLLLAFFILLFVNRSLGSPFPLPNPDKLEQVAHKVVNTLYAKAEIASKPVKADGDVIVHFLDVGQGDCELIQAPGANVLIDAGDVGSEDAVIEYLKMQGVQKIDLLIATHPHADHIGGMSDVIKTFEIGKILFSDVPKSLVPTDRVYETLLDTISDKGLKITKASPNMQYNLGDDAIMTVLGPVSQYETDLNEASVVCRLVFGETAFLFTGDCSKSSEDDLVKAYGNGLSADVLKLGHHGSDTSTQDKWLSAVQPATAIASCGYDNKYGHPAPDVLRRLEERGITLCRTDRNGTIVAESDGSKVTVHTEK